MPRSRWITDLHWKRDGKQSRSQKTQEALLDAAELLFYEKGSDATSVADVAAQAGCSVGAVYHHFRDKKALLYALFERMTTQFREIGRDAVNPARWEGATIVDILRGFIEFSLELGHVRPGFKRSALEATQIDPSLKEHFAELQNELFRGLNELLMARRHQIGHPYPEMATRFVIDQISAMLRSRNDQVTRKSQITTCTDDAFAREALVLACAYLQVIGVDERN